MKRLLKNKKGLRFDLVLIGFIVVAVVALAGVSMIRDLDNSYDEVNMSDTDDDFGDVYNQIDEIYDVTEDIKDKAVEGNIDKDESEAGSIAAMTRGAYSAVRLIPKTFSLYQGMINAMASTLGLGCGNINRSKVCAFVDFAFLAFVISVIFGIVYWIRGFINPTR